MFRRAHYIVLGSVVALVLILLNLPSRTADHLKLAIGGLFLPLFGLASSAQVAADKAGMFLLPRRALVQEVERLRRENEQLRFQLQQEPELRRENTQLRRQISWQQRSTPRLKPAHVVARDPANWWRTLQIDAGARDGVMTNLPVLTPEGLVGRVSSVGLTRSQVVIVGDPNCRVSALVQETRDHGVISAGAAGVADQQVVYLTYLPSSSSLTNGQAVITSGFGGVFPKGLPIGRIIDTRSVGYGLYLEAQVKLSASLNHLEEVWVLLP